MKYRIKLKSLKGRDFPEEFYHFLMGYCLPGLFELLKQHSKQPAEEVVIEHYGPVLDQKFEELLDLFQINYRFADPHEPTEPGTQEILTKRWDMWAMDLIRYRYLSLPQKIKVWAKAFLQPPYLFQSALWNWGAVKKSIRDVRRQILDKLAMPEVDQEVILLLKRAEPSEIYDLQKGRGNLHRYGVERRSLIGIEKGANDLSEMNHNVVIFEPGSRGIIDQIRQFGTCSGIVGIRGAELANMLWMPQGSRAVVVDGFGNNTDSPTRLIAEAVGVEYRRLEIPKNDYPELNHELICRISQELN